MSTFKNLRSLGALNKYLFRYRKLLIWGIVFVIVSNFFAVISARVVGHAFDEIINNLKENKSISGIIINNALLIIGAAFMTGLFMFFMRQTIIVMSRRVEFDMKNDIYSHFQDLSLDRKSV